MIDEAYYEYAAAFAAIRGVGIIRARLSTCARVGTWWFCARFPKCTGWPELRVGERVRESRPVKVIEQISRQRAMYCVSSLAQAGALAALDDIAHIRKAVREQYGVSLSRLIPALTQMGYSVTPTWANFLYCDLQQDAAAAFRTRPLQQIRHCGSRTRSVGPSASHSHYNWHPRTERCAVSALRKPQKTLSPAHHGQKSRAIQSGVAAQQGPCDTWSGWRVLALLLEGTPVPVE